MNLFGIKTGANKAKRKRIYAKLAKLGYTHRPGASTYNGVIVITPTKECELIPLSKFDTFMFDGYIMYEARDEEEFYRLIKTCLYETKIISN